MTAQVAYSVLPPKIAGILPTAMSRTAPPPTAVIVPNSTAGSQPNPTVRVFCAPAAAQQPNASASTKGNNLSQTRPSNRTANAIPAPINAVVRYA